MTYFDDFLRAGSSASVANPCSNWVMLSDGARPTEDIYFLESVRPQIIREGGRVVRINARRRWLPKSVWLPRLNGANLIICRSLPQAWLSFIQLHRSRFGRIFYLIDDDLAAVDGAVELPEAYRARLFTIAQYQQPYLLAIADEVVATSHYLAERLAIRHARVSVLEPPLIGSLPTLQHFDWPTTVIGYHGTRAHLQDLAHINPALEQIHEDYGQVRIELMLGRHIPASLSRLSRVSTPKPMPWKAFRQYRQHARIHIGLAPLLDTPFNRGKSHIKFLDIALMGGVGLYSNRYPYTELVEQGVDGLLVDDDPDAWSEALRQLLNNPVHTRTMAAAAAKKAAAIGDPAKAIGFWQRI